MHLNLFDNQTGLLIMYSSTHLGFNSTRWVSQIWCCGTSGFVKVRLSSKTLYHCLAAQIEQIAQRWSSPEGVGQWHWGQRGKPCDRACITLAHCWKVVFGLGELGSRLLGTLGILITELGCSRHKPVFGWSAVWLGSLGRCHWAVEKRISAKGLGSCGFNFCKMRWRSKVKFCAQAELEVATHKTSRCIERGRVWAATAIPTVSVQHLSKRWNGCSCHLLCCSRALKMWLSDLKDILLRTANCLMLI